MAGIQWFPDLLDFSPLFPLLTRPALQVGFPPCFPTVHLHSLLSGVLSLLRGHILYCLINSGWILLVQSTFQSQLWWGWPKVPWHLADSLFWILSSNLLSLYSVKRIQSKYQRIWTTKTNVVGLNQHSSLLAGVCNISLGILCSVSLKVVSLKQRWKPSFLSTLDLDSRRSGNLLAFWHKTHCFSSGYHSDL